MRSVLGRFLEHSRILSFQAGDRVVTTGSGSADLMPRNLDRRIEVMAPIEDSRLRARDPARARRAGRDTRFAWELDRTARGSGSAGHGEARVSAQEALMARATKRAKKRPRRSS